MQQGVRHTDDHSINLVQQIVDQLDLVGNLHTISCCPALSIEPNSATYLGTAQNRQERALGAVQRLLEVIQLLLHQQTSSADGKVHAHHTAVGAMGSTKGVIDCTAHARREH